MAFYLVLLRKQQKSIAVVVLADNFDKPVEMLSVCKQLEFHLVYISVNFFEMIWKPEARISVQELDKLSVTGGKLDQMKRLKQLSIFCAIQLAVAY
jgi:hypothetical protein